MADNPTASQQVQKIAVANNAALMVAFTVHFKDSDGKDGFSSKTDHFPFAQSVTVDMAKLAGIKPGIKMRPRISPVASTEKDGPEVEFAENGLTATYTVTGTAFDYKVALL
jgi:hypothetical protein